MTEEHSPYYYDTDRNKPVVHGDMQRVGNMKTFHTPAGDEYTRPIVDPLPAGTELYAPSDRWGGYAGKGMIDWKERAEAAHVIESQAAEIARLRDLLSMGIRMYEDNLTDLDAADALIAAARLALGKK